MPEGPHKVEDEQNDFKRSIARIIFLIIVVIVLCTLVTIILGQIYANTGNGIAP